jgi:hypothetical protein
MNAGRIFAAGAFALSLLAPFAGAQPVVAPSNEPVGPPRGEDKGDYNITNSFEAGYRWRTVDGNLGKYRSDVNFGNGIRLLSSSFTMNSKDGHGHYFDELLLNTLGLGNDPYEFANFRVQKNKVYRYDLLWRENDYFNPALTISNGEHLINTSRRFYDQSLTLLPQSKLRFFLGYGRNSQSGPALTTLQFPDNRGDEFPLFSNIRRVQDEYRLGGEFDVAGVKLTVLRGWEHFKDDTTDSDNQLLPGNNPADAVTLTSLQRSQPYHGSTDSWRVYLISDRSKLYSLNGRFTYAGGRRNFIFDENVLGTDRFGSNRLRQTFIFGNARRPVLAANFTASVFPTSRLTITNQTAIHSTRMDGDSTYSEINNTTLQTTFVNFQYLGIRTISNTTDVQYQLNTWASLYGGYQFSNRRIRSIQQTVFAGVPDSLTGSQENTVHAGLFGLRLRPLKPLTIRLDAEVGHADRPFFPISDKNYQALNGRVQYKLKSLLLSGAVRTNYNTNSVTFSAHSSRSRSYSADASWAPREWLSFDAGYNKIHLNTSSGIAYFLQGNLVSGTSIYISNIHAVNLGVRFSVTKRADLFVGYNRVQDLGDGRSMQVPPLVSADPFYSAQTFPLSFESPLARLSLKLTPKLRWNAGYQFYRYHEKFSGRQNYRAHTGYTSVTWAF